MAVLQAQLDRVAMVLCHFRTRGGSASGHLNNDTTLARRNNIPTKLNIKTKNLE
jgi:hypothetical protein